MKKMTTIIIFVLALTQLVGVVHAVVDSIHHDTAQTHAFESVVTNTVDNSNSELVSNHSENCQFNCHSHCHAQVFLGTSTSHVVSSKKTAQVFGDNQFYIGFIHGPDSPPPSIL